SDEAKAWFPHGNPGAGNLTGRVLLNLNFPDYYNAFYPWLDIWKQAQGAIQYLGPADQQYYATSVSPGVTSGITQSAYLTCCDANGETLNTMGSLPNTIHSIQKILYEGDIGPLPL